ncbi:MAG: LacI family transcriptional regulator [Aestuariivirga sp.]
MTKIEPPIGERPTLKTIAFMTGLGVSTVSQALKDGPDISRATKQRVQLVAKQIGYRPNRAGVRLRTGKTNVIALVLNTKEEGMGLVSEMVYGISEALTGTSYHLVVTPYSLSDPMEPIRYIVETGSADGIILSRTQPDDPRVRYLAEHAMPFATHGRTDMDVVHPFHDFDNQAFAFEAVKRIVEKGNRKVALIGPPPGLMFQKHTRAGFEMGLREFGLQEHWISDIDIDSPTLDIMAKGFELGQQKDRPGGIVCSAAITAIALSAGLIRAGLKIGQDIDVVTKQSTQLMELLRPEIIFIHEDFRAAGRDLARSVMAWIDGADPAGLQSVVGPKEREGILKSF